MTRIDSISLGVSVVLYRTRVAEVEPLIRELLDQGAARIYLVDNSPLSFDTFGTWVVPEQVTIIRVGRNVGYGSGHNIAIYDSIRHHRYHLVCNPDIQLGKNVLHALSALMDSRSHVGISMPEVVGTDGSRHYLCKRAPSPLDYVPSWLVPKKWRERSRAYLEMRDQNYDAELQPQCLSGCFMFLRGTVIARIGAFDERFFMYFEDFDFSRRIRGVAGSLYYPAVRVVHEHRSGHRRSLRLLFAFGASAFRYFSKWGWFESAASRAGSTPSRIAG